MVGGRFWNVFHHVRAYDHVVWALGFVGVGLMGRIISGHLPVFGPALRFATAVIQDGVTVVLPHQPIYAWYVLWQCPTTEIFLASQVQLSVLFDVVI